MDAFSDDFDQSIDEQYLQLKLIKWGFKWWFRCANSTGYVYEFDIYLDKKRYWSKSWKGVVFQLTEKLEKRYCTVNLTTFSIVQLIE